MKLFYFLDFGFYGRYKKSITGSTYVRYKHGPIPTEADRIIKQLEKENHIRSFEKTYHGRRQKRYAALAEYDASIFNEKELNFMWAITRFFSPLNAKEMTELAHSETPWRVTPPLKFISYELADLRALSNLETAERLSNIASSLSYDIIVRNTPGLVKEIKDAVSKLPKSKFYTFEEIFN